MPGISEWQKLGLAKPSGTDFEEHSAVGDVSSGRRFKASQLVPMKSKQASTSTYTYYGFTKFGTATSDPLWRILREELSTGNIDAADGDDLFDNVWDDRASLSYL